MPDTLHTDTPHSPTDATTPNSKDWVRLLSRYRAPTIRRSLFELCVTLIPFLALWALAWWALSISPWLATAIAVLNGAFLVRLFMIQHDCGHGAFFANRHVSDWVGRALGVLTITPYDVWRQTHAIHHASTGNLDRRGVGDLPTLTVQEYRNRSRWGRLGYRLVRNPLILFGLGPIYIFIIKNRIPAGLMRIAKYWTSAMATNLAIALALTVIIYFGGLKPVLLIFLPTAVTGAAIGVWLFYIQHQFEDAHWQHEEDWQIHDAALHGSSYYDLPGVLRWFSGNIGIHHVHHLYSRIPFYRLTEVLRDHPVLATVQRMTLRDSLACARLHLWDEDSQQLVSFAKARRLAV